MPPDAPPDTPGDTTFDTPPDSSADTTFDVPPDTTADATVDVDSSVDGSVDSTVDTTVDTTADSSADSTADSSVDSTFDLPPPDTTVDSSADSTADASLDSTADASLDSSVDSTTDADFSVDSEVDSNNDFGPPPDASTSFGLGVETLAGWYNPGNADGTRYAASFNNPVNVTIGPGGDIWVADFDNHIIRRITAAGVVTTVGTPSATFKWPFGIAFVGTTLYVETDVESTGAASQGALWRVDTTTGARTLVADQIGKARGLVPLSNGNIVLIYPDQHRIAIFDPGTTMSTPLAGTAGMAGYVNATGAAARFNNPYDGVIVTNGDLIVTDRGNHRLRRVTMAGVVTDFAGTGVASSTDGPVATATFNSPLALCRDSSDNIFVTDADGYVIRKITSAGVVSTVAGDGVPGVIDAVNPLQGRFYGLEGLDCSSNGLLLYVADGNRGDPLQYNRIRRVAFP
ncbi:MAG: hypothetical protein KC503_19200 [Myxococcales bacterium]|nr:hypothetical protein [Myxococcales bacterium]